MSLMQRIISCVASSAKTQNIWSRLVSSSHDGNVPLPPLSSFSSPPQNTTNNSHIPIIDFEDPQHLPLPVYPEKNNETLEIRKQRLIYQSRKRGMLENDILLSTFAAKYLNNMNEKETALYDNLINGPTNDWDIYYWATGLKPTPEIYNTPIMNMLKEHVKNPQKEKRIRQPNL